MKLYNSLTGQLEEFLPLNPPQVRMYVCGPTVYDSPHLGHARSAVSFDMIRKYLEFKGFKVKYVSNYTDVDDKMIKRAEERGIDIYQLAQQYIDEYEAMQKALRIRPPDIKPRATQEIPAMISLIKALEIKGFTYLADNSVYFDTSKMPNYKSIFQQIANRNDTNTNQTSETFTTSDYAEVKRNVEDFVLWKHEKPGEPAWESPWGRGRPGWHLECSAMSMKYLGETIDIHGGGKDLKSPHHKNEIAQSECANGKQFCKYWLHNGFLTIDSNKMSKSLGNFIPLMELIKKYPGDVLRFYFINSYYQRPMDFEPDKINQAIKNLEKIRRFQRTIQDTTIVSSNASLKSLESQILDEIKHFFDAMDEDFNTVKAIGTLFSMINFTQKAMLTEKGISKDIQISLQKFFTEIDSFFCILTPDSQKDDAGGEWKETLSKLIMNLLEYRKELKIAKNYVMADKIREILNNAGIKITDIGAEASWEMDR